MSDTPTPETNQSLPAEIHGFTPSEAPVPDASGLNTGYKQKLLKEITQIQKQDFEWKVTNRPIYGKRIMDLLIGQNIFVGSLVFLAFLCGKLQELEIILGVLVTGTLVETAFSVRVVIQWLFSDTKYPTDKHLT